MQRAMRLLWRKTPPASEMKKIAKASGLNIKGLKVAEILKLLQEKNIAIPGHDPIRVDEDTDDNRFCTDTVSKIKGMPLEVLQRVHYKIKQILKQHPPAKDSNKFTYGDMLKLVAIELLREIGTVDDLDLDHSVGSEYKNDIRFAGRGISIKAKKGGGAITLVNKRHKSSHDVSDTLLLGILCDSGTIFMYPLKNVDKQFFADNGGSVDLKENFIKHYVTEDYKVKLPELSAEQKTSVDAISEVDVALHFYSKLLS